MSDKTPTVDLKPQPRVDPFKPSDPRLPGVTRAAAAPAPSPKSAAVPLKYVLAGLGALVLGAAVAWWLMGPSRDASQSAHAKPATAAASAPAPEPPRSAAEAIPTAPGAVARVAELREPWATKVFRFRQALTDELVPAILVRLPGERGGYWAFSAKEPFGRCLLQFVSDRERLAKEFGYRAQHPMVVDPCNGSVYHPLRWGNLPDGSVARGEVVAGPAIRPPLAVQIVVRGSEIHALRLEP